MKTARVLAGGATICLAVLGAGSLYNGLTSPHATWLTVVVGVLYLTGAGLIYWTVFKPPQSG